MIPYMTATKQQQRQMIWFPIYRNYTIFTFLKKFIYLILFKYSWFKMLP